MTRRAHGFELRENRFRFFQTWLLVASIMFALQGLMSVVIGSFDPLGIWDHYARLALFPESTESELEHVVRFRRFVLGPFGATLCGYFILMAGIVGFAMPRREPWAYWTVWAAILAWFSVDCIASAAHGALFNIALVNLPCLVVLGIPLIGLRPFFASAVATAKPRDQSLEISHTPD